MHIEKKEDDRWYATSKLDLRNKKLSKGELKTKFPKSGARDYFVLKGVKNDYGDFLDNGGNKVQSSEDQSDNKWWTWEGVPSSDISKYNYQIKNGSSNFVIGWDYFLEKINGICTKWLKT